jgi:hypothetical protein
MAANETVGDVTSTWPPAVTPAVVDEHCRLVGDEDCGVGVACGTCDLGGQPIAYYHPGISENPYPEVETPTATGIFHLYLLAAKHVREHHRPA